jgi:DNA polymerase/3'-5' exonuclease PolX
LPKTSECEYEGVRASRTADRYRRGYKFRAGLIDRVRNAEINLPSEREILAFLGLPYVPPELRNADG